MSRLRTRVALGSAATLTATAAVATFAVGSSTASSAPFVPAARSAPAVADTATAKYKGVNIKGAVGERGAISRSELAEFIQRTVKMTYQTSGGPQSHRYTGPLLFDVLNSVEPNFSSDRHDLLRYAILIRATDGFLAVIAWGEIEPELANKRAIIALTEDGKKLIRPRVVLPGDHHGARQVYDVASISLLRLTPEMANGTAGKVISGEPGHEHH